jgi:hypothetical protein
MKEDGIHGRGRANIDSPPVRVPWPQVKDLRYSGLRVNRAEETVVAYA